MAGQLTTDNKVHSEIDRVLTSAKGVRFSMVRSKGWADESKHGIINKQLVNKQSTDWTVVGLFVCWFVFPAFEGWLNNGDFIILRYTPIKLWPYLKGRTCWSVITPQQGNNKNRPSHPSCLSTSRLGSALQLGETLTVKVSHLGVFNHFGGGRHQGLFTAWSFVSAWREQ